MNKKAIKPIPKYIERLIQKTDKQLHEQNGFVRFYAYLTKQKNELVKVTVAVHNRYKKWYCKQVATHGLHSDMCYVKDLEYCGFIGMGYRVGWHDQGLQRYKKWFESDWCRVEDKYYDPFAPIVNREFVSKLPQYKHSAVEIYTGSRILQYLRLYERYPQIEYLMKAGLQRIVGSKSIVKLCGIDRAFCKWLMRNKEEIRNNYYYVAVILSAYKTGRSIKELQTLHEAKLKLSHDESLKHVREIFKRDMEKLLNYVTKQDTNLHTYLDYLKACEYLGLDITEVKHSYPTNFKCWHDIRIDEYNTAKALADEQARKELYKQFASIASKYTSLEHFKKSEFIAVIAKSPAELMHEGEALHHCVGRMNYDQKFIREETLIFFVRSKALPETPLVTVEYSLLSHKILQCYGEHNSKPNESVLNYINNVWLRHANRKLKLIA